MMSSSKSEKFPPKASSLLGRCKQHPRVMSHHHKGQVNVKKHPPCYGGSNLIQKRCHLHVSNVQMDSAWHHRWERLHDLSSATSSNHTIICSGVSFPRCGDSFPLSYHQAISTIRPIRCETTPQVMSKHQRTRCSISSMKNPLKGVWNLGHKHKNIL
jgi:hypothetical protein